MTRLIRMLLPVALCALLTGAIVLACGHHGPASEAPATPVQTARPGYGTPGERDAGSGASLTPVPPTSSARLRSPTESMTPEVQLAAQPGVPEPGAPGPGAPTTPGSPTRPGAPNAPIDAGVADAYSPPLPPVPDAGVPGDSKMEPILGDRPDARLP